MASLEKAVEEPLDILCEFRRYKVLEAAGNNDNKNPTASSVEQRAVESSCLRLYELFQSSNGGNSRVTTSLRRDQTISFLHRGLKDLSEGFECLDASRPWLVYWILHSLELLNVSIGGQQRLNIIKFLAECQNPDGGFGGGPYQLSHLAPTYATVNALVILGGNEAYKIINRETLVEWMNQLRLDDGSFIMHIGGEVDIRGVYCALSVAMLTNTFSEELFHKTAQWVLKCQTYEGGFGGVPGMEAHGGYSFCGLAALMFLRKGRLCNIDTLLKWAANRQMRVEGGFQGRTNKLVDGCYSFWQGGIFPLLQELLKDEEALQHTSWLFDHRALQEYLIVCCQDTRGGLVDKPGKSRDYYHTCYTLSGLSVAQHMPCNRRTVLGDPANLLVPTHPLFNIGQDAVEAAKSYFSNLSVPIP